MLKKIYKKVRHYFISKEKFADDLRKQGAKIGDGCDIDKNAYFGSEPWLISIGDNTRITRGVQFITHDGGLWTLRKMGLIDKEDVKYGSIIIGKNCNISWGVTIMPNVVIGDNCVIAAGAVVTKNVPANSVWGGVPAKPIESISTYAEKVKPLCIKAYSLSQEEKRKITNHLLQNNPWDK